jgi:hypothetical protein
MSIPMSAPSGRSVTVAALQFHCVADAAVNVDRAEALVREAAAKGANLILLQVSVRARMRPDDHACVGVCIRRECTLASCDRCGMRGQWLYSHTRSHR